MMPGVPKAKVKSRIILTPQHAKRLMKALNDNISKFEAQHGERLWEKDLEWYQLLTKVEALTGSTPSP